MQYLVTISLFLVFVFGCVNSDKNQFKKRLIEKYEKEYIEARSQFPEKFVDHIPKEFGYDNYITDAWSVDPSDEFSIKLFTYISDKKVDKTIKKYTLKSEAIYSANQECLFILNRFSNMQNYGYLDISEVNQNLINRDCYKDKYPVPNFWGKSEIQTDSTKFHLYSDSTKTHLPADFKIYVFDAEPGKFLSKEKLTDGTFMPDKWKNGYSRGVAISKKRQVLVYWVIIW